MQGGDIKIYQFHYRNDEIAESAVSCHCDR